MFRQVIFRFSEVKFRFSEVIFWFSEVIFRFSEAIFRFSEVLFQQKWNENSGHLRLSQLPQVAHDSAWTKKKNYQKHFW